MSQTGRSVKQIGSYQYNERHCLGEGAYGKVFQGQDIRSGETVAIKKMDLALFEKDTYLRNQIVSEIEILKKFNHPNIVRFIDLITTQRSLYIVTEFCKDGDLKELLAKKRLIERDAQSIMLQIVNGFKELVKHGVIHRDLKPANILNHEGIVKIADFGFAKYVDNYTSQLLRSCVGSPLYMAPQILQRKTYSTKCDVWSIGVIFYEMVFFDVPWKGRDEQDLLKNILMKPLVFKSGFQISEFTREFLTRTLAVDESERISWDQVFSLFEQQEKQLVSQSPTLQKLYGESTWMVKNEGLALNKDQLSKQLMFLNQLRCELTFRHFVNIELNMKYELIKQYCRKDNLVEDYIMALAKLVLQNSGMLVQLVTETCDAGEDVLMKGTKWNIINNLKKESDYYQILFDTCRDTFAFEDLEWNDQERNRQEELLQQRTLKIVMEAQEEQRRRGSDNHEVQLILEYLLDLQIVHKNFTRLSEQDYNMIHQEKAEDIRKNSERIQNKIRQLQKF